MSVLGLNSKDRKSTRDKANISNPKVNRGCAPLTPNRISSDGVQISLGPPIPYIPLRVHHTGGFNAMDSRNPNLFTNFTYSLVQAMIKLGYRCLIWPVAYSPPYHYNLCQYRLMTNQAWLSNYIYHKLCDEITNPFPNFNSAAVVMRFLRS